MRRILGGIAGAATGALGALILGEYPFSGAVVFLATVLFGLALAEVVVVVGRERGGVPGATAAALTAGGLVWAAWISEGHDLTRLSAQGWLAVALGVAVAGIRGWRLGATVGSPTGPAPRP